MSAAGEPWTSALQAVDEYQLTAVPDALVHGDCWQGNSLWVGGELRGFVDWDAAGTGPPGIDLATMRLDAAFFFGVDTMDDVVTGWAETSGRPVGDLAYWDLVAALTSPIDLGEWLPNLQRLGRPDLDAVTMAARSRGVRSPRPRRDLSGTVRRIPATPGRPPSDSTGGTRQTIWPGHRMHARLTNAVRVPPRAASENAVFGDRGSISESDAAWAGSRRPPSDSA